MDGGPPSHHPSPLRRLLSTFNTLYYSLNKQNALKWPWQQALISILLGDLKIFSSSAPTQTDKIKGPAAERRQSRDRATRMVC